MWISHCYRLGLRGWMWVGDKVLKALRESGGYLPLGDKSSAHDIKTRLGVSKSAFKQAIGRLYKQQLITLVPDAIRLVPGALTPPDSE